MVHSFPPSHMLSPRLLGGELHTTAAAVAAQTLCILQDVSCVSVGSVFS